jgi:hypothetical protein
MTTGPLSHDTPFGRVIEMCPANSIELGSMIEQSWATFLKLRLPAACSSLCLLACYSSDIAEHVWINLCTEWLNNWCYGSRSPKLNIRISEILSQSHHLWCSQLVLLISSLIFPPPQSIFLSISCKWMFAVRSEYTKWFSTPNWKLR